MYFLEKRDTYELVLLRQQVSLDKESNNVTRNNLLLFILFYSVDDDEDDDEDDKSMSGGTSSAATAAAAIVTGTTKKACGTKNGAHIHLWQFLKELLASGQQHGSCIRWLDQSRGVFKIEDSVRVARLWGIRKNRPAMNYDKLSRSIRQYYRKGIMRKTERSQRLVYQFCHPYGL